MSMVRRNRYVALEHEEHRDDSRDVHYYEREIGLLAAAHFGPSVILRYCRTCGVY